MTKKYNHPTNNLEKVMIPQNTITVSSSTLVLKIPVPYSASRDIIYELELNEIESIPPKSLDAKKASRSKVHYMETFNILNPSLGTRLNMTIYLAHLSNPSKKSCLKIDIEINNVSDIEAAIDFIDQFTHQSIYEYLSDAYIQKLGADISTTLEYDYQTVHPYVKPTNNSTINISETDRPTRILMSSSNGKLPSSLDFDRYELFQKGVTVGRTHQHHLTMRFHQAKLIDFNATDIDKTLSKIHLYNSQLFTTDSPDQSTPKISNKGVNNFIRNMSDNEACNFFKSASNHKIFHSAIPRVVGLEKHIQPIQKLLKENNSESTQG